MEIVKPWYLSRTIWASTVVVAVSIAGMFGLTFEDADVELLADGIVKAVAAIAGLVAIFGRLSANSRIG